MRILFPRNLNIQQGMAVVLRTRNTGPVEAVAGAEAAAAEGRRPNALLLFCRIRRDRQVGLFARSVAVDAHAATRNVLLHHFFSKPRKLFCYRTSLCNFRMPEFCSMKIMFLFHVPDHSTFLLFFLINFF